MAFRLLPQLLDLEREQIRFVDKRWQPRGLLFTSQARAILDDLNRRYKTLSEAREEMLALPRGPKYVAYLTRMRFFLREAHFVWKGDQLRFIRASAGFYTDYGTVLRFLKEDSEQGDLVSE